MIPDDELGRRLGRLGEAVAPREPLADPVLRRLSHMPTPTRQSRKKLLLAGAVALAAGVVLALLLPSLIWRGPPEEPELSHTQQGSPPPSGDKNKANRPQQVAVFFSYRDIAFVNSKWGFIDRTGKVVVEPRYTAAQDFAEGLAAVCTGKKWGYIDRAGKVVIEPRFDVARPFSEGLAAVRAGEKWGYVDRTGKVVIEPQFENAGAFSEGLAAVCVGGRWGYLDPAGQFRIKPRFADAGPFRERLAPVAVPGKEGEKERPPYGYIDPAGKLVIEAKFEYASSFSEGRAAFRQGQYWGYLDHRGKVAVPAQYDVVWPFKAGRARVRRQVELKFPELRRVLRDEQVAIIDPEGKLVEPFVSPYTYGLVYDARERKVKAAHEKVWDGSGETVLDFPIELKRVRFHDGMAQVCTGIEMGAKHGFIDQEGKLVIAPELEWAEDFHEGLARFAVGLNWEAARRAAENDHLGR